MSFSFESWPCKFAIVLSLLAAREFVRRASKGQRNSENGRAIIETIDSAAIALGVVLFIIQPFILQAFEIPSGSMRHTLPIGDRILVSKLVYRVRPPDRGDAIVFIPPPAAYPEKPDDTWIKRCVGVPGDVITAKGRTLFVNGRATSEPYQFWDTMGVAAYDMKIVQGVVYSREYTQPTIPGLWTQNSVPVDDAMQVKLSSDATHSDPIPAGEVLMLGDHRNDSKDGHFWGLLDESRIVGKAVCVFWPPTHWGVLDRISQNAVTRASLDAP